ncbi:MAG TPA: uracil-DNA glycosylase [Candidatus Acidoferrales bacterium]|nr:uracil-DNA glycosylase [Candidatus Acidoferrales bacterium]
MDSSHRSRLEAWLHYSADIGIGPYYRGRASNQATQRPSSQQPVQTPMGASSPPSIPLPTEAAPRKIAAAAGTASAASLRGTPVVIPVLDSPFLFDERIEGDTLERIREVIGPNCTRCKLHRARTNIVFGVGNPKAELIFVGEGPGRDEDEQGEPFVGRAGKLLTQMIEAMSLRREDVYICNVVKCRPPENRLPEKDEISTCSPFLFRQIAVIQPKVICCLGSCAAQTMLQTNQGISRFRGEWFDFRGSRLIATYHPAYLLRNPNAKGEVWKDLQKVMAVLNLQPRRK